MADLVPTGALEALDYPQSWGDYAKHPGLYSGKHPRAFLSGYTSCYDSAAAAENWCDRYSGDFSRQALRWAHQLRFNGFANSVDKLLDENGSHLVDPRCIRLREPATHGTSAEDCKPAGPHDDTTPCGLWKQCKADREWSVLHKHSGVYLWRDETIDVFKKACRLAYDLRHNEDDAESLQKKCPALAERVKALAWRDYP